MSKKAVQHGSIVTFEKWWIAIITQNHPSKFTCYSKGRQSEEDWTKVLKDRPHWYEFDEGFQYSSIPPELL